MRLFKRLTAEKSAEMGTTLLEVVVALAVLGVIAVVFLGGVTSNANAAMITNKRVTALSIAQSQTEWAKDAAYQYDATHYTPAPLPDNADYADFSANITAIPLNNPDQGIQKIVVSVSLSGVQVLTLESYKVAR